MKNVKMNFAEMTDNARQIETLAGMLAILAETGNVTDVQAEDTAVIIRDLATELRNMIETAQTVAADISAA